MLQKNEASRLSFSTSQTLQSMSFLIKKAQSAADYETAKKLVLAYVEWLGIDLSYQQFDRELTQFQQTYGSPQGSMILAFFNDKPVGCIAVRYLEPGISELKRMYILEESRGQGLGRLLLVEALQVAKAIGYKKIRLDTLPTMPAAVHLYESIGFYLIAPYRYNPNPETLFMELDLTKM